MCICLLKFWKTSKKLEFQIENKKKSKISKGFFILGWRGTSGHSFKNRTGSLVRPEKIGTDDLTGLLSALDRPRH
jgi:hypothetical protein